MITPKEIKRRANVWGVCQGCLRERRFSTKTFTLLPHRKWIATVTDAYGIMVPCEGSGYRPVTPQSTGGNHNG